MIILPIIKILLRIIIISIVILVLTKVIIPRRLNILLSILISHHNLLLRLLRPRTPLSIIIKPSQLIKVTLLIQHNPLPRLLLILPRHRVIPDMRPQLPRKEMRGLPFPLLWVREPEGAALVLLAVRLLVLEGVEFRRCALAAERFEGAWGSGEGGAGVLFGDDFAVDGDEFSFCGGWWRGVGDAAGVGLGGVSLVACVIIMG